MSVSLNFNQDWFNVSAFLQQANEYMEPVSLEEHPDYEDFIFRPMDLQKLETVCNYVLYAAIRGNITLH